MTREQMKARVGIGRLFLTVASRERDGLQRAERREARRVTRRPLHPALYRELERCLLAAKAARGTR
jgi:hypothetical protein